MEPLNADQLATAYHEAGHAVVAMSLGRVVDQISIVRNTLRWGQMRLSRQRGRSSDDAAEAEILILFAGVIAEGLHTGQHNWQGANQDLRMIRRLIRSGTTTDRQQQKIERRLFDKCNYIIQQQSNWTAIEMIVGELQAKHTMSGRTAKIIFDRASGN